MAYGVGIIGPKDLVEMSADLMAQYPQLSPVRLPYENEEFTMESVSKGLAQNVHAFLFTGYLPYYAATSQGLTKPAFYYPIADTGLVSLLFHLQVHDGIDAEKVSIDALRQLEIYDVYHQLGLSPSRLHINFQTLEEFSLEQYVEFHRSLFEKGIVEASITAVNSVYRRLLQEGVRAYRLLPTKAVMERTINLISTFVDGEIARDGQLMFQIFRTGGERRLPSARFELLCRRLEAYAQGHHGAFFVTDSGEIIILINQGIFKKYSNLYESVPELGRVQEEIGVPLYLGIGMGRTAWDAESNSRDALRLAQSRPNSNAYLINEDKQVLGPIRLADEKTTSFALRTESRELVRLAELTDLSVSTLTKIQHLVDDVGENRVTSKTIRDGLQVTLRSANRIIKRLVEVGAAVEVGVEDQVGRGRPRRIYELRFNQ